MPKRMKNSKRTASSKRQTTSKRAPTTKATTGKKSARTWIVTASGERPLQQIASDLKAKGVKVEAVLDEIGCITIEGDDDTGSTARKVKGVADVSPDASINIGPPNSSDTW